MTKIAVYVATTAGPVRVERIVAEDAPLSQVYQGRNYRPLEPLSGDYARFVAPNGPVARALGPFATASFRLELSGPIDSGYSWELGLFVAHGLAQDGSLAGTSDELDRVVLLTGRVDIDLKVGAVGHIADKIAAAREFFDDFRRRAVPIALFLPKAEAQALPPDGLAGVETVPVESALDALRSIVPDPTNLERAVGVVRDRRLSVLSGFLLAIGMAVLFVVTDGWDRLKPMFVGPASVPAPQVTTDEPRLAHAERDRLAADIADDLLKGFSGSQDAGRRLRLALWPFDDANIPVAKAVADDLNARLLPALLDKGSGRYEIVTGDALRAVIVDMERRGIWDETGGAPVASLLKFPLNIDLLIEGQMTIEGGAVSVAYRAIRMDGAIAARTLPRHLAPVAGVNPMTDVLTRDQAVSAAARLLTERSPDMTELRLDGIRFQDSGQQTPFGLYLQERLAAAFDNAVYNVHAQRRLKVTSAGLAADRIETLDGAAIAAGVLRRQPFGGGAGVYTLSGSYWDFGDRIEVRLVLRDDQAHTVSWVGRIRSDNLADLAIRPGGDFGVLRRQDGRGPIAVHLSSDRGNDPAYRLGERLHLILRVDREAWISCFYRQVDRRWVRLFPNAHHPNGLLVAGRVVTLPGKSYPFDLTVTGPVGVELVKCFATTRDVAAELPADFRALDSKPSEPGVDARLLQAFRSLDGVGVTEASLIITVLD